MQLTNTNRLWMLAGLTAFLAAPCATGQEPRIAVVSDTGSGDRLVRRTAECAQKALGMAGVQAETVPEGRLLAGVLYDYDVAILPYSPKIGHGAQAALRNWCREGGRVILFHRAYGLEPELGLLSTRYVAGTAQMPFHRVQFRTEQLEGLPESLEQPGWGTVDPRPAPGTKVLGHWTRPDGRPSEHVAATLSEHGFYFSHVPVPRDEENTARLGQMLRAASSYLAARARRPERPAVAVVYGTATVKRGQSDARIVQGLNTSMASMLDSLGVPYAILSDEAVADGVLGDYKLAILPCNSTLADGEAAAIGDFVQGGGKLIGLWMLHRDVLRLVGVESVRFKAGQKGNPFLTVRFGADAPPRFPPRMEEESPNLAVAKTRADGQILARWWDAEGQPTGHPAVIRGPHGFYYSYILRARDMDASPRFIMAAVAELLGPEIYGHAARRLAKRLWQFRRYQTRDELGAECRKAAHSTQTFIAAVAAERVAADALKAGRRQEAFERLRIARALAERAFVTAQPTRHRPEFRGAWLHSPEVPGNDWDALFKAMRDSNLNALLVNVCNASSADYESDLLPLSRLAGQGGPQMARMFAAARRHGIEIHLWRVNLRLGRPGRPALAKLKAEQRICLDAQGRIVGGPDNGTLCPSHPENRTFEVEAMLEMAGKLEPDGVHFDYIRYPSRAACYCAGCRARFEQRTGRPLAAWPKDVLEGGPFYSHYQQFRRDQITAIVRETSRRMRREHPDVKLSAAVFGDWESARETVAQDWSLWAQQGWLDFICTMTYTQNAALLADLAARQKKWAHGRTPLFVGLGAWRAGSAWRVADLTDTAFAQGADGIVYFQLRGRSSVSAILEQVKGPLRAPARTPWAQ